MHMKRTTIWLNADHTRQLASLGKPTGQRPAQLIRVAIAQYLARERRKGAISNTASRRAGPNQSAQK
jgi:predicted transcriptional regulator